MSGTTTRSGIRAATVVVALAIGLAGLVGPAATAAEAPEPEVPEPEIAWAECPASDLVGVPETDRPRYSCGHHTVPLDHDRPDQGSIDIALMRRAAGDTDARIGSLFLNPGGPGGSGHGMPRYGRNIFEPEVLDRFDLIGFDPRGVGRSTPVRCFATNEDADDVFGRMHPLPVTRDQENATLDATEDYGRFCDRFARPLIEHMSTAAVARDLDLLRAAVGDEKLTYVGFSYGTLLGATYANLFPARSRALVLDGNVDPTLRLRDGLEYDRQRTAGFQLALAAFLERCDQDPDCAFGGDARRKFTDLRARLREVGPVTLPDGTVVDEADMVGTTGSVLYNPVQFGALADSLQEVYEAAFPSAISRRPSGGTDPAALFARPKLTADIWPDAPYTSDDSYAAVNCSDKPFANRPDEVPGVADRWERHLPDFGRYLAWGDPTMCPAWPVRDAEAYRGPWDRRTDTPVLVIGNHYDPATRYEFARRMARQLDNALLVGVDAFGHCILGASSCVDRIAADYLIDLQVPPPGTLCHPDAEPFPTPPAAD